MWKEGDVYLMTDAYRHGNEPKLMSPFYGDTDANKKGARKIGEAEQFYLQAEEASMRLRHYRLRPGFRFSTLEYMFAVSAKDLDLPDKPRKHFLGTTRGDALGPIKYMKFEDQVQITYETKKKLYGSNIRRVGGPGPNMGPDTGDEDKPEARKPTTIEPMFYHQYPKVVMDEYCHSFSCRKGP